MNIGDLARDTGTKPVTIRYYEKIGLLPKPPRTNGNYRAYDEGHRQRLRFIRRCRELGFALHEVRELLNLSADGRSDCADIDRITAAHLADVEEKIADLQRLADELYRLATSCKGGGQVADCRIVEALSPGLSGVVR